MHVTPNGTQLTRIQVTGCFTIAWEWMPREAEIWCLELLKHNPAEFCPDVWEKIRD